MALRPERWAAAMWTRISESLRFATNFRPEPAPMTVPKLRMDTFLPSPPAFSKACLTMLTIWGPAVAMGSAPIGADDPSTRASFADCLRRDLRAVRVLAKPTPADLEPG